MALESSGGERQSIHREMASEFDDSFVRDWARWSALRSRVFGSVADAWQKRLRQGLKAESILTRSFYVFLGFTEYLLWFIVYAFTFLWTSGGYDLPHDDDHNEQSDGR